MLQQKISKESKSFFLKGLQTNNILLKDKEELIADSLMMANTFNNNFISSTSATNLKLFMRKSKSTFHNLTY